ERIAWQVETGQTPEAVAEAAGVCPRTVRKWVDRYRREGLAGLQDGRQLQPAGRQRHGHVRIGECAGGKAVGRAGGGRERQRLPLSTTRPIRFPNFGCERYRRSRLRSG